MKRLILMSVLCVSIVVCPAAEPIVGGPCDGCEPKARIAPVNEVGEPMVITGRVVARDGTPRVGAVVYAYHTDARGVYPCGTKSG